MLKFYKELWSSMVWGENRRRRSVLRPPAVHNIISTSICRENHEGVLMVSFQKFIGSTTYARFNAK